MFNYVQHEALDTYYDPETIPINEPGSGTLIQLQKKSALIAIGYVPRRCKSFSINLRCQSTGNIAFHLNPRLDRGYVVRNSKIKGSWENEETCSPAASTGQIFKRQTYFHLIIFCGPKEFQISVNGEHFCSFVYRVPLELITDFSFEGDVEDIRARVTSLCIYPDPKIIKPYRNLQLTDKKPLLDNLNVPVDIKIFQNFKPGETIFIRARLKLLPISFTVNLQQGQLVYPPPDIALHFNPRFCCSTRPPAVVINTFTKGSWSREERNEKTLSWCPGREFLLTFRCEYDCYLIWLDSKLIIQFKHRIEPSIVDTLHISGDIILHQVSLAYYD